MRVGGGGDRDRSGVLALLFSLTLWQGETKPDGDLGGCSVSIEVLGEAAAAATAPAANTSAWEVIFDT